MIMLKIIYTQFMPATNHKGSRVKARSPYGNVSRVNYDHSKDGYENHLTAAQVLMRGEGEKPYELIGHGERLTGPGYAFVFRRI
jgi:hypothetical protein